MIYKRKDNWRNSQAGQDWADKHIWTGKSFEEKEYNQKVVGRNRPGSVPSYTQYKNNQIRRAGRRTGFSRIRRSVGSFIFGGSSTGRSRSSSSSRSRSNWGSGRSYKKRFSGNNFNSLVQTLGNNYINKGDKLTITGNRVKARRRRRTRY